MARIKKSKNQILKEQKIKIKEYKKTFFVSKKDDKKYNKSFCFINGYIPKLNIILNDQSEYINILQSKDFDSLRYIIDNLDRLHIKMIQNNSFNGLFYTVIKHEKTNNKNKDMKRIKELLDELSIREDEFHILSLKEIFKLLRQYTYRDDKITDTEINKIINNPLNEKKVFQSKIYSKDIKIIDNKILFNVDYKKDDVYYKENKDVIKHIIFGLQMYPSYLYEGFLTEINYIDNVDTSTYISLIDKEKILSKILDNSEQSNLLKEVLSEDNKLYNTCFYIHIYGNEVNIQNAIDKVELLAKKYHVLLSEFQQQQIEAYSSYIPLCSNKIKCLRAISNLSGIYPYNRNMIKKFDKGFNYGIEKISNKQFTYNRDENGLILSSSIKAKKIFINYEKAFLLSEKEMHSYIIDFSNEYIKKDEKNINLSIVDFIIQDKEQKRLIDDDKWLMFKMYLLICLTQQKMNKNVDINDKKDLLSVFKLLEDKEKDEVIDFINKKERTLNYLEKHYIHIYKKIMKIYDRPSDKIREHISKIFNIIIYSYNITTKKYVYVYNIQEIIECLDLLLDRIFKDKNKTIFLFTANIDYILYNDDFIKEKISDAPYLNIVDIYPNDLLMLSKIINFTNDDMIHLSNKKVVSGILLTNDCEFEYYYEKVEKDDSI